MSYPRYNTMSYPNELTYPQSKAGLYAESNNYRGLIVNLNPKPYVHVPSLAEAMVSRSHTGKLCSPFQFSQSCTSYVVNDNSATCMQNNSNKKCNL